MRVYTTSFFTLCEHYTQLQSIVDRYTSFILWLRMFVCRGRNYSFSKRKIYFFFIKGKKNSETRYGHACPRFYSAYTSFYQAEKYSAFCSLFSAVSTRYVFTKIITQMALHWISKTNPGHLKLHNYQNLHTTPYKFIQVR